MVATSPDFLATAQPGRLSRLATYTRRNPTVMIGSTLLGILVLIAIVAPWVTVDPLQLSPIDRLKKPSDVHTFGTDMYGRDIFSRTLNGSQISLIVGLAVAVLSTAIGLTVGLVAGFVRWVDAIVMRIMDGLMAIPGILLAIALMALFGASVQNVIIALTIIEIPRVTRLVRGVVLTIREMPYVEAAISIGTSFPKILIRHILPNTVAPLIVQATYVCASAMIFEALLSFLGAGTPPEVPSWGNMISEGRAYFQIAPHLIFFPGVFLAVCVLVVNVLGDGLRDTLDPRLRRRM
jgi:peptide/nickel transport system permease protein